LFNRKGVSAGVLWGKVLEVCVCVVFGWQESERKGEKINFGLNSFYFIFSENKIWIFILFFVLI
jgi:hypothetical protein